MSCNTKEYVFGRTARDGRRQSLMCRPASGPVSVRKCEYAECDNECDLTKADFRDFRDFRMFTFHKSGLP